MTGYRRSLVFADLFELRREDTSKHINKTVQSYWEKELHKQQQMLVYPKKQL